MKKFEINSLAKTPIHDPDDESNGMVLIPKEQMVKKNSLLGNCNCGNEECTCTKGQEKYTYVSFEDYMKKQNTGSFKEASDQQAASKEQLNQAHDALDQERLKEIAQSHEKDSHGLVGAISKKLGEKGRIIPIKFYRDRGKTIEVKK